MEKGFDKWINKIKTKGMTPKEKAEELVTKFSSQGCCGCRWDAKESANDMVDEILEIKMIYNITRSKHWSEGAFWEQVKKELEKITI